MKDHITIAGHDGAFAAYIARLKTVPAASEDVLTAESDYQRQQRALSCRQTESNLMPGVAGLVSRLVERDFRVTHRSGTNRRLFRVLLDSQALIRKKRCGKATSFPNEKWEF